MASRPANQSFSSPGDGEKSVITHAATAHHEVHSAEQATKISELSVKSDRTVKLVNLEHGTLPTKMDTAIDVAEYATIRSLMRTAHDGSAIGQKFVTLYNDKSDNVCVDYVSLAERVPYLRESSEEKLPCSIPVPVAGMSQRAMGIFLAWIQSSVFESVERSADYPKTENPIPDVCALIQVGCLADCWNAEVLRGSVRNALRKWIICHRFKCKEGGLMAYRVAQGTPWRLWIVRCVAMTGLGRDCTD